MRRVESLRCAGRAPKGEEKERPRFLGVETKEKRGLLQSALSSRGSSNGRTPARTSEEMSVRIRRPELQT
jgi:hypothetical protein